MTDAVFASTNPESHDGRTEVRAVVCSTPGCELYAEQGEQCVHCRLVPRRAPAIKITLKDVASELLLHSPMIVILVLCLIVFVIGLVMVK